MILVNTLEVPNQKIVKNIGLVMGSTIRAKHIGKDILSSLRHLVGGELKEYTEMISEARQIATDQMIREARNRGANAIVNIRYSTTGVMEGAAEIMVYGTAVVVE